MHVTMLVIILVIILIMTFAIMTYTYYRFCSSLASSLCALTILHAHSCIIYLIPYNSIWIVMTPPLPSTKMLAVICYQECSWGTLGGDSRGALLVIYTCADQLPSIRDNSATSLNEMLELIFGKLPEANWPRRDARSVYNDFISSMLGSSNA